jgi:hypothetical protein
MFFVFIVCFLQFVAQNKHFGYSDARQQTEALRHSGLSAICLSAFFPPPFFSSASKLIRMIVRGTMWGLAKRTSFTRKEFLQLFGPTTKLICTQHRSMIRTIWPCGQEQINCDFFYFDRCWREKKTYLLIEAKLYSFSLSSRTSSLSIHLELSSSAILRSLETIQQQQ